MVENSLTKFKTCADEAVWRTLFLRSLKWRHRAILLYFKTTLFRIKHLRPPLPKRHRRTVQDPAFLHFWLYVIFNIDLLKFSDKSKKSKKILFLSQTIRNFVEAPAFLPEFGCVSYTCEEPNVCSSDLVFTKRTFTFAPWCFAESYSAHAQ